MYVVLLVRCPARGMALGWRWGVPDRLPPITERPFFLAYDVTAGGALILLAFFGLTVARQRTTLQVTWSRTVLWVGGVVTGVRALVGVIGDAGLWLTGQSPTTVTLVADLWFAVASAFMFALLVAHHGTAAARGSEGRRQAVHRIPAK